MSNSGRSLTIGEIQIAQSIYGDTIDYSQVLVFNDKHNPFQSTGRAMAPNGNIYFPPGNTAYSDDISTGSLEQKWTFVHEMGHVLQHQSGINLYIRGGLDQLKNTFGIDVYDYYDDLQSGQPFYDWSIEAQASYFADVWFQREFLKDNGFENPQFPSLAELNSIAPVRLFPSNSECFSAGTEIKTWRNGMRLIENVTSGDWVCSYDQSGRLVPGRVKNVFKNEVNIVLNVHGLFVTPGHITLCGEGQFAGLHVPIIDILCSDGALVTESGELVRASINKPIGSIEDQFVEVEFVTSRLEAKNGSFKNGRIRVGTLLSDRDHETISMLDSIKSAGMKFEPETGLVSRDGQASEPLKFFGALPRPEDYVLRRSGVTLDQIRKAAEWEGVPAASMVQ